jgi:hypothetical protein
MALPVEIRVVFMAADEAPRATAPAFYDKVVFGELVPVLFLVGEQDTGPVAQWADAVERG